jgi:hypothetical protein
MLNGGLETPAWQKMKDWDKGKKRPGSLFPISHSFEFKKNHIVRLVVAKKRAG